MDDYTLLLLFAGAVLVTYLVTRPRENPWQLTRRDEALTPGPRRRA